MCITVSSVEHCFRFVVWEAAILQNTICFTAGNVWIYRIYGEWSKTPGRDDYCDPTLYWFAFWITTATYIIIGTVCFCICCAGVMAACVGDNN